MWKTGALSLLLHDRLAAGDEDAIAVLFKSLVPILRRRLRYVFRDAPDATIADAIDEALVQFALDPSAFNPARGVPLDRFLCQASWRNVADILRVDRRRRDREATYAGRSAILRSVTRTPGDESGTKRRLLTLLATDAEREAVTLWLDGHRRPDAVARALGLTHLPASEQRLEVKRFNDRVVRRLARLRKRAILKLP